MKRNSESSYLIFAWRVEYDPALHLWTYPTLELGNAGTFEEALNILSRFERSFEDQDDHLLVIAPRTFLEDDSNEEYLRNASPKETDFLSEQEIRYKDWHNRWGEHIKEHLKTPRTQAQESRWLTPDKAEKIGEDLLLFRNPGQGPFIIDRTPNQALQRTPTRSSFWKRFAFYFRKVFSLLRR